MDEPFSHIDNFKKTQSKTKCFFLFKRKNTTCILATHDKDDVLAFSDKILVLDNGKIINQGSPKKLYNIPGNIKTAAFFRNLIVLNQTIIKHLILKAVAVKLFAIPIKLFLIIVQKVRLL